ncbi:MAG TPA: hypothetical protein PKC40_02800 [Saprospiraceae bacterium]|nr:hypothetical protein [Saprospiraceae bacterium]
MKSYFPWLLLLITSFQWIGGRLIYSEIVSIHVEREMSEVERRLADSIEKETGVEAHVKIIEENSNLNTLGYSSTFVLTREMDGKEYRFLLDNHSIQIFEVEIFDDADDDSDRQNPKAPIPQRLFSDYTIPNFLPLLHKVIETTTTADFVYHFFAEELFPDTLTPPPEVV